MKVYDRIIFQLLNTLNGNNIFATGLRQVPVGGQITTGLEIMNLFEITRFKEFIVEPRMTRDFKLTFKNKISEERAILF